MKCPALNTGIAPTKPDPTGAKQIAYVMAEAAQPCVKSEDLALADQSLVCWAAATKLRLTLERSSGSSGRELSRIATTASLTEGTTMGVVIAGSLAPKHGDLN